MVAVTVDAKFRITIPKEAREGLAPDDVLFVEHDLANGANVLHYVKAENPFDVLAAHALEEYRAGRTRSLRDIAAEEDIEVTDTEGTAPSSFG